MARSSGRKTVEDDNSRRPRDHALSPALLARVFHQPALVYFGAVAKHLSVREAARHLNVASSAVSRQIAHMEDALAIELFRREGRRLHLTSAGEILYRHTQRLAAPLEAAISELDMLRGLRTGSVRIASVESVALSFLPELISGFARKYPRLHMDVSIVSAAEVVDRLIDERADVGFGFLTRPQPSIELALRRDVNIGVLMRPGHPLASAGRLTVAACMAHPIAVAKRELSIRDLIEPLLRDAVGVLPPCLEVDSIRMLVALAARGHHASIMTPIGAQDDIERGELIFRRLEDRSIPTNRFGLMARRGLNLRFAPAVFYEHAKSFVRTVALPGAI